MNSFVFAEDISDELIGLLQRLKTIVSPNAAGSVSGFIRVTQNIQTAADNNDLEAASELLQHGANIVADLLPKLTDGQIFDAQFQVLKANIELNQRLDAGNGDFDDVSAFVAFIAVKLEQALYDVPRLVPRLVPLSDTDFGAQ